MPYTSNLIFDASRASEVAETPPRELCADTDAGAIAEAARALRASRVVAGVKGNDPPQAGVIAKDGQEFVCVIVNPPLPETGETLASTDDPSPTGKAGRRDRQRAGEGDDTPGGR